MRRERAGTGYNRAMSGARKLALAGGALLVLALALVALLLLPALFDAESQRNVLTGRLEGALQRKVKLGSIRLSLLPPSLLVEDAEIAESLGFGNPSFSTAKKLRARVNLFPLLRGTLEVPSVVVDEPTIRLVKSTKGEWNFSSLGRAPERTSAPAPASRSTAVEIQELTIRNGTLTVAELGGKGLSATYEQINVTLRNFGAGRPFDFEVSTHIPGAGKGLMSAEGRGGPLNPQSLAASPAEGKAHFEEVDLRSLAAFTGQPGLAGLFTGDATFSSDGRSAPVEGSFRVDRLQVNPKGRPAQAPLNGKFKLHYAGDNQRLELRQVEFSSGKSVAHLGGKLDFARLAASELTARAANASLPDVAKLLPAFGVGLPAGSSLASGTLNANALLRGPFQHNNGRAAIEILNARLAGYSLGSQLAAVAKLAGIPTGADTEIQKLKATLNFTNGTTSTNDLELVAPGMTVTGAGSATEAGQLDMRMTATLTRPSAVGGVLQKVTGGSNTVPFFISGTLEHPIVRPDVQGMAQGMAQQKVEERTGGLGKVLGGLFGKKK